MPSQPALVTHTRCLSAVFEPEVPAEEEEEEAAGNRQNKEFGRRGGEEKEKDKVDEMRSNRRRTGNACQVSGS